MNVFLFVRPTSRIPRNRVHVPPTAPVEPVNIVPAHHNAYHVFLSFLPVPGRYFIVMVTVNNILVNLIPFVLKKVVCYNEIHELVKV